MPIIPLDKIYAAANAKSLARGGRGLAEEEEEQDQAPLEEEEEVSGLADFALSIPRGVLGAAEEILEIPQIFGATYEIPDNFGAGTSKTTAGSMTEGITSFATGFIPVLGWMGKAGKAGKVVKGGKAAAKAAKPRKTAKWGKYVAAGAIADFAVFDGHEARLSDLIQMYPALENPVSEYLASNIEDSELEGRLKNVVEGAAIGGVIDILAASLRLVRKSRDLRAKGASPEEVLKGTAREQEELIKANKKVQQDKQQKKAKKEQQQKPQQEGQDPLIPEKPEAPEPKPAPKNPRHTAILKELTKKPKKGQKSASQEMLDDITNNPPEEALAKILARFQKDGVLININSFTDGDTVSREALALIEGLGDAILKTKKDFLLDDAHRTAIIKELDEFGFPESSALFQNLADQHAMDAKFLSASISMRNHTKQMTENLVNRTLLQEQLAKATTHSEKQAIGIELNKAELRFLQHREQGSVLATALGAVRSKRGRDLVNLRWMDEAALKQDEKAVADHLDTLLANKDLTPEQHAKAMDAAAAVAKKHGDAGLAKLGPGKGMIDMHNELWINALLSGPRTSAINFIGNAITGVYLPLEKGLGAQLAYWRTKDARFLTARNELFRLTFFLDSLRESLSLGVDAFWKGDSIIQKRAAVTAELEGAAITGKAFQEQRGILGWIGKNFEHGVNKTGKIIRIPTNLLTGTDEFFKQMQFRYMVKAQSAMKAHDQLLKKYGEETIPTDELATLTSDIMEGIIREGGERYSAAAVRRDGWEALQQAMKDEPDGPLNHHGGREPAKEQPWTPEEVVEGKIPNIFYGTPDMKVRSSLDLELDAPLKPLGEKMSKFEDGMIKTWRGDAEGTGNTAEGFGRYATTEHGVAEYYARGEARNLKEGVIYEYDVNISKDTVLNQRIGGGPNAQPKAVQKAWKKFVEMLEKENGGDLFKGENAEHLRLIYEHNDTWTGAHIYSQLVKYFGKTAYRKAGKKWTDEAMREGSQGASKFLKDNGVDAMSYQRQDPRFGNEAHLNYVILNTDKVRVVGAKGLDGKQLFKDSSPERGYSALAQQEFMRDYYLKNFDETKGAVSDAAFKDAQEATFTSPQEGPLGGGIQKLVGKIPALRLVMPFVSTPLNILKFFGQRTGAADLPITRSMHSRYMKDMALDGSGNPKDPMAYAAAHGRLAGGTALWTTATLMATQGKITGHGPEKESERAVLKETGWLPYAFEIDGTYISYERLDPFATFFGMAADLTEYANNIDREDDTIAETIVPAVITGLSQNVFNKSYMTGIEQFMNAASQPQRFGESYLRTRISSYVPAILGQAAGSLDGDEAIREARTVLEALKKKIPGAGDLDPRRNALGEIVKQPSRLGPDYLSPVVTSSRKKDAVINEMAKAQHAFTTPSSKIQGGIDLIEVRNNKNQTAYDRWLELQSQVKIGGKTLRQQLSNLVKDKRFQNLSDIPEADFSSPRAKAIKRVISRYRALAKRKMLSEFPDLMKESALVDQINFNRARGRDVEGLLQQLKGLR